MENELIKLLVANIGKVKTAIKKLQDNFYQYITDNGFDLERGKSKDVEHLSTEKFKQITNYDNIKYELTQEQIKPIETQNTFLIIQQNKELIKYTNKLKVQLSKSYTTINKIDNLQKRKYCFKV